MIGSESKYALITGATNGIGYELARLFAKDGKNLVILARNKGNLERVKMEIENEFKTTVWSLSKDLSDPNAPQEIYSELENKSIDIDVLVNNAGFGVIGKFLETDLVKHLAMIQVFTSSLTHLTKLFLQKMLKNKFGIIVNVSSGLALIPIPRFSTYSACEAYVLHFSEALNHDLRGTGVRVTCICPSPTRSAFWERANVGKTKLANLPLLNPALVARIGYQAIKRGKATVTIGFMNKSLLLMNRIMPRNVAVRVMGSMMEWGSHEAIKKNN